MSSFSSGAGVLFVPVVFAKYILTPTVKCATHRPCVVNTRYATHRIQSSLFIFVAIAADATRPLRTSCFRRSSTSLSYRSTTSATRRCRCSRWPRSTRSALHSLHLTTYKPIRIGDRYPTRYPQVARKFPIVSQMFKAETAF